MKHKIKTSNGDGTTVEVDRYARSKAIKLMCTECCGWGEMHPKDCLSPTCPLFPFRGKSQAAYANAKRPPKKW